MSTLTEFGSWVQEKLFFLDYAPVIFTSAHRGSTWIACWNPCVYVAAQLQQKIPTAILNRTIQAAWNGGNRGAPLGIGSSFLLRHAGPAGAAHLPGCS